MKLYVLKTVIVAVSAMEVLAIIIATVFIHRVYHSSLVWPLDWVSIRIIGQVRSKSCGTVQGRLWDSAYNFRVQRTIEGEVREVFLPPPLH